MAVQAPSLANINLLDLGDQMRELKKAGVTLFHIDIMDGHYVPNLCFPLEVVKDLRRDYKDVELDVHLMVENPMDYVDRLAEDGVDYISFHADGTRFVRRLLTRIRGKNVKAGVVINPSQPVSVIEPYAEYLDYATIMAVEPGISGQTCLPGTIERVRYLSTYRKEQGLDFKIFLDGGMSYGIIEECIRGGADVIITGNYAVFQQADGIAGAVRRFQQVTSDIFEEF